MKSKTKNKGLEIIGWIVFWITVIILGVGIIYLLIK